MLTFLNPLFWIGLLAVGTPIWLHLRRRTETNVLAFSTLRFLDDLPQPRQSPLRLRDLLLFALRVLGLLLIVAAFAWPYLRRAPAVIVKESRVYILDNTLSQQVDGKFERDRDRIAQALAESGPEIQNAVIELAAQPNVVLSFADDREAGRQKVQALKPTHQRGAYLAAFRMAKTLLANSLGAQKRILFYGDNQENQWHENAQVPPFLDNVEVTVAPASTTNAPNLSLSEPRLQRIYLGDKSVINFSVKLTRHSPARQANIILRANDQVIFNRNVDFDQPLQAIQLNAQWESDPSLWLRGDVTVEGTPDALAADNRLFFSLTPVREGQVALLARSDYLRLALSPEVMKGHWKTRQLNPADLGVELAGQQDADVLVIESNYLQSPDARKLIWRYLTNRRGVLLFVNRVTPTVTGALRELGFEPQGAPARQGSDRLHYVYSHHPIFHPFQSAEYGNLLEVEVRQHERLKTTAGMPLIFSQSGDALFFQGTRFPGKLFVATFGMEREQTTWPFHATFIPFLDLCLQNSRAEEEVPTVGEPGDVTAFTLPSDNPAQTAILRQNDRELQRLPVAGGKVQVHLPDAPGLYNLSYDNSSGPEIVFSVNPSPKESELTFLPSPDTLNIWTAERRELRPVPEKAAIEVSMSGILHQHWWWWLVVAAVAALLLESALVGWRKETI